MKVLVFQHARHESLGRMGDILKEQDVVTHSIHLNEGEKIPLLDGFDALIAMGGPMSVYEEEKYPWLRKENETIQQALERGILYLGVCLGSQLLAKALGARVYPNRVKEIGFGAIAMESAAKSDLLFKNLPQEVEVFQWHGDTFDLPNGAELLATSEKCRHQIFRWGKSAYGIQPHFEVTTEMIADWVEHGKEEIVQTGIPRPEEIIQQAKRKTEKLARWNQIIVQNFLQRGRPSERDIPSHIAKG